jgi:hypothetical protein
MILTMLRKKMIDLKMMSVSRSPRRLSETRALPPQSFESYLQASGGAARYAKRSSNGVE